MYTARSLATAALLVAATTTVAACGSGTTGRTADPAPTPPATPTPTPASHVHARTYELKIAKAITGAAIAGAPKGLATAIDAELAGDTAFVVLHSTAVTPDAAFAFLDIADAGGGGTYEIWKAVDGRWKRVISGQDYQPCTRLAKAGIPAQLSIRKEDAMSECISHDKTTPYPGPR